jgi:hypothetical protein
MHDNNDFLYGSVTEAMLDDDRPTPRPTSRRSCSECGDRLGGNASNCEVCWEYAMEHNE